MINKKLRDRRAQLLQTARSIAEKADAENRQLTADERRDLEGLTTKIADAAKDIEVRENLDELEARRDDPGRNGQQGGADGGRSFGEFVTRVVFSPGELRAETMSTDSHGFLVPEQHRAEVLALTPEDAIVRPRAMVLPAGDPPDGTINIPALDHRGANGLFAGVQMQWIGEGVLKPLTDVDVTEIGLTPKELAGHVVLTDRLLRNSAAVGPLVSTMFRRAIAATEDRAFLRGSGVGQPLGVLQSAARINVPRNTAAHVKFVDVANMLGRLLPESFSRACWVASITSLPDLATMVDASDSTIWIANAREGLPVSFFGMELRISGRTPTLGNEGDLMLCDFKHYVIKDGSGPFIASSPHVLFRENKTVIKAFWNVDGQPWMVEPVLLEDGVTTVSPFVVLQ